MKRASLSALPASPKVPAAPADLTDRLLERDIRVPREPAPPATPPEQAAPSAAPTEVKLAPRRRKTSTTRTGRATPPPAEPSRTGEPDMSQALAQAQAAAEALRMAARAAPARYELALRYRLEALAHHVQQVAEFVAGRLAPPK